MAGHDISQVVRCKGWSLFTHASMCEEGRRVSSKTVRRDNRPDNPEVREEMKAIASNGVGTGYRRLGRAVERKGMIMNAQEAVSSHTGKSWVFRRAEAVNVRVDRGTYACGFGAPGGVWSLIFGLIRSAHRCPGSGLFTNQ